jgi:NAD(P)-dependent dehydrogenase (short-subunit alcohol dehydrogenase family)
VSVLDRFGLAGRTANTDALDIPPEEWARVVSVNVNGQFYIAQAVGRHMAEQGGGSIVAIGSNSGFIVDRPQPQAHYNASKAAVHQMMKSLAIELVPKNIRVNAVAPGYVMTELTKRGMSDPEWLPIWIHWRRSAGSARLRRSPTSCCSSPPRLRAT